MKIFVYTIISIFLLVEIGILVCYLIIFKGKISLNTDDWDLFYQITNGLIIATLTVVNIAVFYRISVSLDVRGKLFEAQSIITQMRVRQYENIRDQIKKIQVQIIRNNVNKSDIEELKKSLMEMDNSYLYKNDNLNDPIFFKPLIKEICDNFEKSAISQEKTYGMLSNFIIMYEFYIIQQLVRDKSIKNYIEKNKGNIDSTLICMHKLEQEANMGEIKYER